MPEAWPATWAPPCAGMHGQKFVPVGPYEPPHHAPIGAWAKAIAGMTDATATNATTIPIRLMSTLRLFAFTAPTAPIRIAGRDRKSTRLNSSHLGISYAVFCLKKKNKKRVLYLGYILNR